ncbi:hypothetical protein V1264_002949 [Littorina saxatilis]|uniref:Endonuclease V n=2 Tax=Littorina saxatilis TaxID=31220 RepID=A0AAN9B511_9CAEN
MALDASGGCKKCGIILDPVTVWMYEENDLCRTCRLAETGGVVFQTPCGQRYCKCCGILIEVYVENWNSEPDFCSACTLIQNSYAESSGKACTCELCSNHDDMSPSEKTTLVTDSGKSESGNREKNASETCSAYEQPREWDNLVEEEIRKKWEREQLELKKQLVTRDCPQVKNILQAIRKDTGKTFYIGGVDISFIKGNNVDACAALVILSFPDLQVVYKRLEMIELTAPYIPGFLAFREVEFLVSLYQTMLRNAPQYKPDVILVDGNGQLHPRGFGLACQLGVLLDVPCVGVGKTLIHVDGIEENAAHKAKKQTLKKGGDTFTLTTDSGNTLGQALRSTDATTNPIYVSVGHKISLTSAVTLTLQCCKYRIPEPTRFADMCSREYLLKEQWDPEEFIA